jgi:hypothetical protein
MTDTSTTTELVFPEGTRDGEHSLARSLRGKIPIARSTALCMQMIRCLGPERSLIKARAGDNEKFTAHKVRRDEGSKMTSN